MSARLWLAGALVLAMVTVPSWSGLLFSPAEQQRQPLSHYVLQALLLLGLGVLLRSIAREFRSSHTALQARATLLRQAEELAHIGCATTDIASGRTSWSRGMALLFGEAEGTAAPQQGHWLTDRVPEGERDFVSTISEGVTAEAPSEFQHRIVHADGTLRTVLHRGMVELDRQGQPSRGITILQDITMQRDAERRIDRLANHCQITGLPNRHALLDQLDEQARAAQREERSIALIVLEIDQLDIVAQSLGLDSGDQLLANVADRLRLVVQGRGTLAHLGDGEFAVLLGGHAGSGEEIDEARALILARSLQGALGRTIALADTEVQVTCAQGLTLCPRDGDQAQKLLQQAQAALSQARGVGGERICVFSSDTHARLAARLETEAALRHALRREEFHLVYQPQLDLHTGEICGAETLLRWEHPKRGSVPTSEFLPLAEESGQIIEIGEWVLRQACLQSLAWQRAGLRPLRVSVNLSVRQLQQPDIARRIQAILLETGLPPQQLGLEITESSLVGGSAEVASVLATLGALGIEIALDDFGTGYSNLSILRKLPIKVLKIDRFIVHDVTAATHDVSMTRAVINMAHALQLKVLAEGVESEGQLALLMANECDLMQGHFFSPAVTAAELVALLQENRRLPEHLFARRSQRERTLLVVDDEENIVGALKRLLRRDGYKILTASSGPQGLQRLAEQPVDVILSDQRMPGMTGVEFLRRAKDLYPDTVRMVLSGYTELQSITDAVNEGAIYKFLTKPWDDERLREHIAEAFRRKEMADENARLNGAVSRANEELAAVNKRLGELALRQSKKLSQDEASLQLVRELLEHIPAAVIGIDTQDCIVYLNADAQALLGDPSGLLFGMRAEHVLPPSLREVLRGAQGPPRRLLLDGAAWQVVARTIGGDPPRGQLLVLTAQEPRDSSEEHPHDEIRSVQLQ